LFEVNAYHNSVQELLLLLFKVATELQPKSHQGIYSYYWRMICKVRR
nr:hypothetical protein [Tanacetum cinerariifolium]